MIGAKDRNNLFLVAQVDYGIPKGLAFELLKAEGYHRFDVSLWDKYIALFRQEWEKKAQAQMTEQERIRHLQELEGTLIQQVRADTWKWFGSPEALNAHWELEAMRREQNRRLCRMRMTKLTEV